MAKFHLPTIEEDVLKRWEDKDIFRRLIQDREKSSAPRYVFFEGPPTANGKPGIHHILTRSFKDVVMRYWTMRGYRIDRKAGWDTHGLPVELEVEKRLGFTKKQDIEDYGIAPFNEQCRESVWTYRDLWEKMTRRVAMWIDMDHPYVTYGNDYVESLWNIFKKVDADGRLYKGYRITPHCPRCVTSLSSHELAQGYKDTEDPSVYVRFRLKDDPKRSLLVWTTTPWTLPANTAVAVGADVDYVEVKDDKGEGTLILARALLGALDSDAEIVGEMKGSDLVGLGYEPLYPGPVKEATPAEQEKAHHVYSADFVSTTDGTGMVHIAPSFGEDDAQLGKEVGLPVLLTVDNTGFVTVDVPGQDKFFKTADADIIADLTERGLMYKSGTYIHSYPFCWRCSTPLLYYAKGSWYIRMSELRDELMKRNQMINWVPDNIKEGRFGEWLREVKDWAISRERYWGTPLPVWECDCGERLTVGSLAELNERAPKTNRFFMMRHGEAETNATQTLSSLPEPKAFSLTDVGRGQVKESAAKLKSEVGEINAIYCSPLLRTRETAAMMAEALGFDPYKIEYRDELREIDFGEVNGKSESEFHACFTGTHERFEKSTPGGETLSDVRRRTVNFLKELRSKHTGENILIVTHGESLWLGKEVLFKGVEDIEVLKTYHETYPTLGTWFELKGLDNRPYDQDGHVDVHRPYIDEVALACEKCGETMNRITDVADVWFDSGAMPYAQWHYPFENSEKIDDGLNYPADYISEAIDQTRGWFYTLLAVATLMDRKEPPFKNCVVLGHILDAKGKKMSKSKGNVIDPFEAIDQYGADAIRYYLFTINQPGEYKRFDGRAVEDVTKKVFLILWNVLSFYKMFSGDEKTTEAPTKDLHVMDKWLLAELSALGSSVDGKMQVYDIVGAARSIGDFVNDLSTWYVRRSRDRMKSGETKEQQAAVRTLGYTLFTLSKLMAPFTPFLADALYKETGGELDSIHMDEWPGEKLPEKDEELRAEMKRVRDFVSLGLEQRAAAGIPVRQALTSATLKAPKACPDWMKEIIAAELNVHEVLSEEVKGQASMELDTEITPALRREGAARELVRHLNSWRKETRLTPQDHIKATWTGSDFWREVLEERGSEIAAGVICDDLSSGGAGAEAGKVELDFHGEKIEVYPVKVS